MDAMDARKKAFAIKIMIGPEDELDSKTEKIQKELSEDDAAPFLPEVDKEEKDEDDEALKAELMGGADDEVAQKLESGDKPRSLREGMRMAILRKKGLSKAE